MLDAFSFLTLLKTLCDSWATLSRYHEEVVLACAFGCAQRGPLLPSTAPRVGVSIAVIGLRTISIAHVMYHSSGQNHVNH